LVYVFDSSATVVVMGSFNLLNTYMALTMVERHTDVTLLPINCHASAINPQFPICITGIEYWVPAADGWCRVPLKPSTLACSLSCHFGNFAPPMISQVSRILVAWS
jgi:hypothetical protein